MARFGQEIPDDEGLLSEAYADGRNFVTDENFIRRPFPLEGEQVLEEGLKIPRQGAKIDNARCSLIMNAMCLEVGIPFSKSAINKVVEDDKNRGIAAMNVLREFFGMGGLDFSGKKSNRDNAVGVLVCKHMSKLVNPSKHLLPNNTLSYKKEHSAEYIYALETMINSNEYRDGISPREAKQWLEVFNSILDYQNVLARQTSYSSIKLITSSRCPQRAEDTNKEYKYWVTPDANDEDIVWVHPLIRSAATDRYVTKEPNIQGQIPEIKNCIKAPEGYSIFSLDISAQDVYPLICEMMNNKAVMHKTQEIGDPYLAFLDVLGYEKTKENKSTAKVPTLSVMNGKAWNTIAREAEAAGLDEKLLKKVYNYITCDLGYSNFVEFARTLSKSQEPYRYGLFGTKNYIDRDKVEEEIKYKSRESVSSAIMRKILNGPFQITSVEILTISYMCLMHDLANGVHEGVTLKELTPLLTIQDELVGLVKNDYDEDGNNKYLKYVEYYMLPTVEGWIRMSGKSEVGEYYNHK